MVSLEGKVTVVTDAARGIGAATARLFAGSGAAVTLLDLPGSQGAAVADDASRAGGRALFLVSDAASFVTGAPLFVDGGSMIQK